MDLSQISQLDTVALSTPRTADIKMTGANGSPISPVPGPHMENSMMSKASKSSKTSSVGNKSFMKELDKVNEQQTAVSTKLAKEKKREIKLKADLQRIETNIHHLKTSTGNGNHMRAKEVATKKRINKLETLLMTTRNKLSSARTENADLKLKIDDKRKDKVLMLHVYHDLQNELEKTMKDTEDFTGKINELHEKKHRVGLDLQNIKERMVKNMEGFSRELDTVKETIEYNQNSLLEGIKDKLFYSSQFFLSTPRSPGKSTSQETPAVDSKPKVNPLEEEIKMLLHDAGVETQEQLMEILQGNEDETFMTYRDVQHQRKEVEQLETDVKHLEESLKEQTAKVETLERSNDTIHNNLDVHIQTIQKQIAKHEMACKTNGSVLQSLTDPLINLLSLFSSEDNPQHKALIHAGPNERNIEEFLSTIEGRIDYIIQMNKAAGKVHLRSDDFKTSEVSERRDIKEMIPHLPQMQDTHLEEEETDGNEDSKLKPVNVNALKEYMIKKVNKMAAMNSASPPEKKIKIKRRHDSRPQNVQRSTNNVHHENSHSASQHRGSAAMPPKEPKSKGFGGRKSTIKSLVTH